MKMTALVENKAGEGFNGEHGLSVYIEYEDHKILLDTGTTGLYAQNAIKLGIDLNQVDMAVLSHAHYDHSGGYEEFFAVNPKASVYLQESCRENCYRNSQDGKKYIGIPQGLLEKYADRFTYVHGDMQLGSGIYLIVHHTPDLALTGQRAGMYRQEDGQWKNDDFSHEQSLVFETSRGLIIFNSCCHAGADVIIKEVRQQFNDRFVYTIIGGFHLKDIMNLGEEGAARVRELGESLRALDVPNFYTGHCTGTRAFVLLKEILGERIHYFKTGDTVIL